MDTGHGGASGRFNALKEIAMEYAFLIGLEQSYSDDSAKIIRRSINKFIISRYKFTAISIAVDQDESPAAIAFPIY